MTGPNPQIKAEEAYLRELPNGGSGPQRADAELRLRVLRARPTYMEHVTTAAARRWEAANGA